MTTNRGPAHLPNMSQNRVPKGVRSGGEFAPHSRDENDIELSRAQRPTRHEAAAFLGSLRTGERVLYTESGSTQEVTVQRGLERPSGYGSWDHDAVVKVGYGPGRWNTDVNAARLSEGYASLRRADEETANPRQDAGFSPTWPQLREADEYHGTVQTTNGGEISGVLSSHGTSYSIDVRTDDGRYVTIMSERIAGVRLNRPSG